MIRNWTAEDIPRIYRLERECFENPWHLWSLERTFELKVFRGVLEEIDGVVVGYAGVLAGPDADLALIAVAPKFRRRGIGAALLAAVEAEAVAAGSERMFLEVRVSNTAARSLYLKAGYEDVSVREKYYGDEDAYLMKKDLVPGVKPRPKYKRVGPDVS